jgi:hypothetical protein
MALVPFAFFIASLVNEVGTATLAAFFILILGILIQVPKP